MCDVHLLLRYFNKAMFTVDDLSGISFVRGTVLEFTWMNCRNSARLPYDLINQAFPRYKSKAILLLYTIEICSSQDLISFY